jgi:hypothetical protein
MGDGMLSLDGYAFGGAWRARHVGRRDGKQCTRIWCREQLLCYPDRGGDQMFRRRAAARLSGWIENRAADRVVSDAGLPARLLIRGRPRRSRTPGRRR